MLRSRSALALLLLLAAPAAAQVPLKADFILQIPKASCDGWVSGRACYYTDFTTGLLMVKLPNGTVQAVDSGGGGGGGAATSFRLGAPGSPSGGDVWYDLLTGGFCGSWSGGTDCFARLGANTFTGAQKIQAAAVTTGTRASPLLTLEGQAWDGSASQPMGVTMQATPQSASVAGFSMGVGASLFTIFDNPALTNIGCGSGGGTCRLTGYSSSSSVPSIQFGTNTTFTSGNDIYTWRNGSSTLMRLQDDGAHKGTLLGLSSITGLVPAAASNSGLCLKSDGTVWAGASCAAGGGGVSSVALSLPAIFSVSGSPVTSSGTLAATLAAQAQNKVWAGPTTGADAAPTFRSLVAADIPDLSGSYASLAGSYSNPSWLTTLATSKLSGQVAIASGGTGAATTSQNFAFIGPTVGSGAPSFRALVAGDVPDLSAVYQPLDADLTALAGASSTGLWARTGAGTGAPRTIAAGTGITVTNGDGAAGNPTVALTTPVAVSSGGLGLTSAGAVANRAVYTADGTTYIVGTLPNQALANSSVTIGSGGGVTGGSVSLGGTVTLSTTSGGDTSGSLSALVVNAIKGKAADTFTTKGDVYVYDGTAIKRLGVGTNGQVLTADSVQATGIKWATPSGGGAGTTTNALTLGTGLTGTSFNGSAPITATVDQSFSPTWTGVHNFAANALKVDNNSTTNAHLLASAATAARTATLPDATGTLAMLALAQSWSATQTHLNAGRIRVNNSADTFYSELTSAATANRTITFPDATDTLCGLAAAQTLTNKTLTTPTIGDFSNATHGHTGASSGGTLGASAIASGQLAAARGGTALDTSASTGLPKIVSGTWSVISLLTAALGGTGIDTSASTGVPSIASGVWSVLAQLTVALGGTGRATLTNHGVLVGAGTSAITQLAVGSTNQVLLGSTGADPAFGALPVAALPAVTMPQWVEYTAAVCQNATASLGVSTPTSNAPTPICITGTNTQLGAAQFTATGQSMQGRFMLPDDWVSGSGNDLMFRWRDVGTTGNTIWKLETKCASDSGAVVPDSWNTGQTQSTAAQGTTLFTNTATLATITTTGCSAGNLLLWRVSLDATTTSTGNHDLLSIRFKLKRTITLQ